MLVLLIEKIITSLINNEYNCFLQPQLFFSDVVVVVVVVSEDDPYLKACSAWRHCKNFVI